MRWRALVVLAVALLTLTTAGAAWAAPKLAVGPVVGDRAAAIPTQLARALCVRFECVLWREVSSNGKLDAAKVRRAGVAGVLTGVVERRGGAALVQLTLAAGAAAPRGWTYQLAAGGQLAADDLRQLERDLATALGPTPAVASRPPAPAPAPPAEPATRPPPAPPPARVERPAAPAAALPRPTPAPTPALVARPTPVTGEAAAPASSRWLAAAELGLFWARRELTYGGTGTMSGTLHGFKADAIGGPRLLLEVYPLARRAGWGLAGLGLSADYARSVGLETVAPSGEKRDTEFSRLRLGLAWRSPPLSSADLVLVPSLSYRRYRVAVSPGIAGLPDADLAGVRPALDAELPLGSRLTLLAGAGWTRWTSAGDLISGSPAFFPGGSASALDLAAGIDAALWGPLSLRAVLEYESTRYSLDADPSGTYAASSAKDGVLGVRAVVRGIY